MRVSRRLADAIEELTQAFQDSLEHEAKHGPRAAHFAKDPEGYRLLDAALGEAFCSVALAVKTVQDREAVRMMCFSLALTRRAADASATR